MPSSDVEILKLWAASGNADAFAELVRRYAPLVYSAALRVLRNSADAEDVAQQCFLEHLQSLLRRHSKAVLWPARDYFANSNV
jgi:DNA-directed RNA polymerase specialized sigma24 family protein